MVKFYMITLCCVLFVLQALSDQPIRGQNSGHVISFDQSEASDEAGQPRFTCTSLCDQVDFGYAGICCGKMHIK